MSVLAAKDDYTSLCEGVRKLTGIDLLQYKRGQMERRIRTFAGTRGQTELPEYLRVLRGDRSELDAFLDRVTINVSQLWRHPEQWHALASSILPELAERGRVRAWSAGCSYGAEAYTLAAVAQASVPKARVTIKGTEDMVGNITRTTETTSWTRWDRISAFAQKVWGQDVVPLFFLNATSGQMPMPFVQALLAMGYRPIPLAASGSEKVVAVGIQRTLDALTSRSGDVLLASHDGDFLPHIDQLLGGDRQVGVVGVKEFLNAGFADLPGLQVFDIEEDAGCFTNVLPRVRIIDLDSFDPDRFL